MEGHEHQQRGGFGGAATPPKPTTSTSKPSAPSSTKASESSAKPTAVTPPVAPTSASAASASTPEPSEAGAAAKSPDTGAAASTQTILSFTPKEFKKWATANPEEALAFREAIDKDTFRMGEDPKQEWIRQTARARKMKEEQKARQAEIDAAAAAREKAAAEQLQLAETTAQSIRYLSEMWGAANAKDASGNRVIDFDAVEEAFRQNTGGLSINDFVKLSARRGVSNPEAARLRADLRKAQLELEKTKGTAGGEGASPATAAASPAAPAVPAEPPASQGLHADPEDYWNESLAADHPLRRLTGWGKLLDHAMLQWRDDDDEHSYSRDAEEIAGEVFQRQIAKLTGGDAEPDKVVVKPHARNKPQTPKTRPAAIRKTAPEEEGAPTNVRGTGIPAHKLVPRGQVNQDRSHFVIPQEKWGDVARQTGGIENVTRNAIERAKLRAKGIDPDTGEAWEG